MAEKGGKLGGAARTMPRNWAPPVRGWNRASVVIFDMLENVWFLSNCNDFVEKGRGPYRTNNNKKCRTEMKCWKIRRRKWTNKWEKLE